MDCTLWIDITKCLLWPEPTPTEVCFGLPRPEEMLVCAICPISHAIGIYLHPHFGRTTDQFSSLAMVGWTQAKRASCPSQEVPTPSSVIFYLFCFTDFLSCGLWTGKIHTMLENSANPTKRPRPPYIEDADRMIDTFHGLPGPVLYP